MFLVCCVCVVECYIFPKTTQRSFGEFGFGDDIFFSRNECEKIAHTGKSVETHQPVTTQRGGKRHIKTGLILICLSVVVVSYTYYITFDGISNQTQIT